MPTVLHISAAGSTWWEKSATGWASAPGPGKGTVWVVTDLAEEVFVEITVPRIYGTDRTNYIDRQLANRFPETDFRLALPARSEGGLMSRLAPPTQTFAAIEPGERVRNALEGVQVPIAGVWSTSLLLAEIGRRGALPPSLFVVLCQASSMRILFVRERLPVLTRLLTTAQGASEQAAEIIRTLRHLENTHVIERDGRRYGVLLLGGASGLARALEVDRLDVVEPPQRWKPDAVQDWSHRLFDLACQSPPAQLAPLTYRSTYLARNVEKAAYAACVVCLGLAVWFTSGSLNTSLQAQRERAQAQAAAAASTVRLAEIDSAIQAYGVAPELVRQALALDTEQIVQAPVLRSDLQRLARILGSHSGARLKSLQWQLLGPNETACAKDVPVGTVAAAEPDATAPPPSSKVELQMTVLLAGHLGPRTLEQQTADISRQLGQIAGVALLQDPARRLHEGEITISTGQLGPERDLQWCLTLPGAVPQQPAAGERKP